jgi:hypothetical protein
VAEFDFSLCAGDGCRQHDGGCAGKQGIDKSHGYPPGFLLRQLFYAVCAGLSWIINAKLGHRCKLGVGEDVPPICAENMTGIQHNSPLARSAAVR